MIGWVPNLFSLVTAYNLPARNAAVDTGQCPAVSDIHSKPYTDPDLPPPYGEGYQYSAQTQGKTWTGQTAGTNDDFLTRNTHCRQKPSTCATVRCTVITVENV